MNGDPFDKMGPNRLDSRRSSGDMRASMSCLDSWSYNAQLDFRCSGSLQDRVALLCSHQHIRLD